MEARKRIPAKNFARPGKGEGPSGKGAGAYPINDRKHAGLAIAFARMHGQSGVIGKACARYPTLPACKKRSNTA
jgi:hypothetical protein